MDLVCYHSYGSGILSPAAWHTASRKHVTRRNFAVPCIRR